MTGERLIIQRLEAACPKCARQQTIELDFAPKSPRGVVVTCDHCGEKSRLSAYQRELTCQAEERAKALRDEQRAQRKRLQAAARQEQKERDAVRAEEAWCAHGKQLLELDRIKPDFPDGLIVMA